MGCQAHDARQFPLHDGSENWLLKPPNHGAGKLSFCPEPVQKIASDQSRDGRAPRRPSGLRCKLRYNPLTNLFIAVFSGTVTIAAFGGSATIFCKKFAASWGSVVSAQPPGERSGGAVWWFARVKRREMRDMVGPTVPLPRPASVRSSAYAEGHDSLVGVVITFCSSRIFST